MNHIMVRVLVRFMVRIIVRIVVRIMFYQRSSVAYKCVAAA